MRTIITILLLSIIILSACEKENISETAKNIKLTIDASHYFAAIETESYGDPFEIDNVLKEENMLYIDTKYGGGCKEHSFELIWGGDFIKTNPPSIGIVLVHGANNDMCQAYLSDKLKIDLKELMGIEYTSLWGVYVINAYNGNEYPN